MSIKKQSRNRLKLHEKLEFLELSSRGYTNIQILEKFGISERTVRNIKHQGPKLAELMKEKSGIMPNSKALRPLTYPEIDENVLQFIHQARKMKMSVTLDVIIQRALLAKESILSNETDLSERIIRLEKFSASKCWVVRFTKRHSLRSVTLHGQGGSVDIATVANDIAALRSNYQILLRSVPTMLMKLVFSSSYYRAVLIFFHLRTKEKFGEQKKWRPRTVLRRTFVLIPTGL